jgi:hypothetical protein
MRWILSISFALVACGCTSTPVPTPTGTTCPDPDPNTGTTTLTWDNFGKPFMDQYCTNCHSSQLEGSQASRRNGAPLFHDFDTLLGVLEVPDHIDEQAGFGPKAHNDFMPGVRCPSTPGGPLDMNCKQPTAEERTNLAMWIACERNRAHTFTDAGVDGP